MTDRIHYPGCWRHHHDCAVAMLSRAIDVLEDYACPGLGACPTPRLKDGSCVTARAGACGDPARKWLDVYRP